MKKILILIVVLLSYASLSAQTANEYYQKGLKNVLSDNYKAAILDFTKAIEINPDYAEAYYNRGRAKSDFRR